MRIWPFAQLGEWADHKRRSREVRIVATWDATTNWVDKGKPTGRVSDHLVEFHVDGNGIRSSVVTTTSEFAAKDHGGIHRVRAEWRIHGVLPKDAWRIDDRPRGKLVSITGGLAS